MTTPEIDGKDIIMRNVIVTCFGGKFDLGDNGQTESGVMNDGRDPNLMGCALPIRSTEKATRNSPLANASKPHIPWGTEVRFWRGNDEKLAISTKLLDNGPDVASYPTHLGDLTEAAAAHFAPNMPRNKLANGFSAVLSYRVVGGAKWI